MSADLDWDMSIFLLKRPLTTTMVGIAQEIICSLKVLLRSTRQPASAFGISK